MGCGSSAAKAARKEGDDMAIVGDKVASHETPVSTAWTPAEDPIIFEQAGELHTCLIVAHGFLGSGRATRDTMENLLSFKTGVRVVLPTAPATTVEATGALSKDVQKKEDQEVGIVSVVLESMAMLVYRAFGTEETKVIHSWVDDVKFKSLEDMVLGTPPEFIKSVESGHTKAAIDYLQGIIREQIKKGIKPEKIILVGHGQGAFVSARAALSFPDAKLGGLIMIAGFLGGVDVKTAAVQDGLPIFFTHGGKDLIIPKTIAEENACRLRKLLPKSEVRFESYENLDHFPFPELSDNESALGKLCLSYL